MNPALLSAVTAASETSAASATSTTPVGYRVRRLERVTEAELQALTDILLDCVEGGASVSFMLPLARERALAFWQRVAEGVAAGERILMVAEDDVGLLGTVQLIVDQPENQPHRADLAKMLVVQRARKRGIGEALMRAAEQAARDAGKTLLVLDTASPEATRLYERCGWTRSGVIPNYALLPQGGYCDTIYFYRELG